MNILTLPPVDGPQVIARILRTRWRNIAVSVIVMLIAAAGAIAVHGPDYTATTGVQVAAVSVDPISTTKNGSPSVDTISELSVARSGSTAEKASAALNGEISAREILDNVAVSASASGSIITIQWTDKDADRARRVVTAVANAFLETRSELILERVKAISTEISAEIEDHERSLARVTGDSPAEQAKRESLRASISALSNRLANLVGFAAPSGRIITPDSAVPLIQGPSKKHYFAGAVAIGIFVGLILSLLRERLDPKVRNAAQLAHIISSPVWSADNRESKQLRWFGAARMATLIGKERGALALLVGSSEQEAALLISALSAAQIDLRPDRHIRVLDLDGPRAELLRSLTDIAQVVIAPSPSMKTSDISQLVDQIDLSGCVLSGAFYIEGKRRSYGKSE